MQFIADAMNGRRSLFPGTSVSGSDSHETACVILTSASNVSWGKIWNLVRYAKGHIASWLDCQIVI